MRRLPRLTLAAGALLACSLAAGSVATAQDLPPGFTDGRPMGEEPPGTATSSERAEAAAATERYFGDGAYAAVRSAVASTSRPCPITDDGLTALVLAPVFKESSAATTPSTAPSPMTLSRYDEWTGTLSTANNQDANYGLYAFRNPHTGYQRAYWHPGIGIWQYDSAGLGAPLTTIEAMDVGKVSADVARIMATRYCNAGGSDQNRRYEAWRDWGFPCTLCQGFFDEMYSTSPKFANLNLVPGITALGGTVRHTCALHGVPGTMPCWYVEPRVGVIQGSTAWATLSPDGGSGPTVAPAPLSHPFYVLDRGTTEERHWLRVDTGYGTDIKAIRNIGKNARPRSNQTGSGLAWSASSTLCDLTTGRGACTPVAPPPMTSELLSINGTYRPRHLDANGDGLGDVLWYAPGTASDYLWLGTGAGGFASTAVSINSVYDDVVVGDFDGDSRDDIVWYARATGKSYLWRFAADGSHTSTGLPPGPGRLPFRIDADGGPADELFWYGPGSVPDSMWHWSGGRFVASARTVNGWYLPMVGDFDANEREDIFWYAPGTAPDSVWLHRSAGGYVARPRSVNGSYRYSTGDLDGDGADDIVWHGPGSAADSVWFGGPGGTIDIQAMSVQGSYQLVVSDLAGAGRDELIWYAPGPALDTRYSWSSTRVRSSSHVELPSTQQAVVGAFSAGGTDGILWYAPGITGDIVWFR